MNCREILAVAVDVAVLTIMLKNAIDCCYSYNNVVGDFSYHNIVTVFSLYYKPTPKKCFVFLGDTLN